MAKKSFNKGYGAVRASEQKAVREEIMLILGIKTTQGFYLRKKGNPAPRTDEAEAIEEVFLAHGVRKSQIWDE